MDSPYLQPGDTVDRFVVEALVGEGGMATVYRVRHKTLDSVHALKLLTSRDEVVRKRLVREGKTMARMRHPNIVGVTDVVEHEGAPGLVMEFIEGPTLASLLRSSPLTPDQMDSLARGIIAGVAEAHGHGLIHRDLKPSNILLAVTEAGLVPKVVDFGMAKALTGGGPALTMVGSALGTPGYMSPEQLRDTSSVDHRTDIFALGAILYQLITGERAFVGADVVEKCKAVMGGHYIPLADAVEDLPPRMARAIEGALQVDVEARTATCEQLLAQWVSEEAVVVKPEMHRDPAWSTVMLGDVAAMLDARAAAAQPSGPAPEGATLQWDGRDAGRAWNPTMAVELPASRAKGANLPHLLMLVAVAAVSAFLWWSVRPG
jgi:serine/threonine protein kinase